MNVYNGAIDYRAEVFVQVGASSYMFNWLVDKTLSRTDSLSSQRHLVAAIDATIANIVNHAHGLEALSTEASTRLSEYWDAIQSLR